MDTALIRIRYERTFTLDTIQPDSIYRKCLLTLFAGKKAAAFYNEETRTDEEGPYDRAWFNKYLSHDRSPELVKHTASLETEKVFRRYTDNKTIVHQDYAMCGWEMTEDTEIPNWEIQDSTMNILGVNCIMAVADFRGRKWIAWFAPDIPLPEGPWKLIGLPGVVLQAYDTKRHYTYEAVEIDTQKPGTVDYFNYRDRLRIRDRRKGLKNRRKTLHSDYRQFIRAFIGDKAPSKPVIAEHRNYDFPETDYTHLPLKEYEKTYDVE